MRQDLRSFLGDFEAAFPGEVVRVSDPISTRYDVMALVLEYERRKRHPILLFERVEGHDIPIVANVMASRRALAFALGVDESRLATEYSARLKRYITPAVVKDPPFRAQVVTGDAVDLTRLPVPVYYPGDAGPYLTAGMLVARDPDTGVETEGFHRLQVKGPRRMGVSLHSRRRMFEYQRRAEAKGQNLPCAVVIGLHPAVAMGSLSYPPADVGKFDVVGGLFGEPFQVADCTTIDLRVPAYGEIVIEGEILAGVREPEGPFGEFTGYQARRSTQHVFVPKAIGLRDRAMFQSIASGRGADHITTLALIREAEILNALSRVIPNVRAVHVPLSGTSSFTAYVSLEQSRPGEARHAIPIVLGADHYLKLVVIVDEDVDVFDESEVMWAVATRMQADSDLIVIPDSLGAILDPSASENGLTAKLGIDATRPFGQRFADTLVMDPEKAAWAKALADRLSR